MESNGDDQKRRAHELIDRLAPEQTSAVVGLLESILDPVARAIANAPLDDEPLRPEEESAVRDSHEWLKHNKALPNEEVMRELGISPQEIERFMKSM